MVLISCPRITSYALTDVGRKRPHNEDALLCDDALGLYVVADGVGGNAMGEVASQEAVEQIHGFVRQDQLSVEQLAGGDPSRRPVVRRLLESAVQNACYMVFGMGELDPVRRGMSTTISALLLAGPYAITAQVGDSRVYLVRNRSATQLTEDHTLVNYRIKQGIINSEQARTMRGKNIITRAVGHKDYVEVDTLELDVRSGDLFLLCSDGLQGYLQDGELEEVLLEGVPESAPQRFVELANDRGGKDNITVVVVSVA